MAEVRSVIAAAMAASGSKPGSCKREKIGTSTAVAPRARTAPRISGQNGAGMMTSSPASTRAAHTMPIAAVAPGMTCTQAGSSLTPLRRATLRTMAAISAGSPCVGE